MKTNNLMVIVLTLSILSSCKTVEYLPKVEELGTSEYGSHISVRTVEPERILGELIAVENNQLIILTGDEESKIGRTINLADVTRFQVQYATGKNYGWTIPVFTVSTLSHGAFLIFTAPINAVVTSVVTDQGLNGFDYNQDDIGIDELRKFARFPQGMPEGISVRDLE